MKSFAVKRPSVACIMEMETELELTLRSVLPRIYLPRGYAP